MKGLQRDSPLQRNNSKEDFLAKNSVERHLWVHNTIFPFLWGEDRSPVQRQVVTINIKVDCKRYGAVLRAFRCQALPLLFTKKCWLEAHAAVAVGKRRRGDVMTGVVWRGAKVQKGDMRWGKVRWSDILIGLTWFGVRRAGVRQDKM